VKPDRPLAPEGGAVAGIEVALHRQAFGVDDGVARQLDVEIGDAVHAELTQAVAVEEVFDGDEDALGEDRMVRRQEEVAARLARREGMGADADRQNRGGARMAAAIDGAVADPADGERAAARGQEPFAPGEGFDRDLAAIGADAGAGGEAGHVGYNDFGGSVAHPAEAPSPVPSSCACNTTTRDFDRSLSRGREWRSCQWHDMAGDLIISP
jgi:hypothetical protein